MDANGEPISRSIITNVKNFIVRTHCVKVIKHFLHHGSCKILVFVRGNVFQFCLIFPSKAGAYPFSDLLLGSFITIEHRLVIK